MSERPMDDMSETRFVTCPTCNGSGIEAFRVTVYEHGCGFPRDDTDERPCRECNGEGVTEREVAVITLKDLEHV